MKSAAKKPVAKTRVKRPKPASRSIEGKEIDPRLLKELSALVDDPIAWLNTTNEVFEGRKPIDVLGTDDEPRLRNRIKMASQGMFS